MIVNWSSPLTLNLQEVFLVPTLASYVASSSMTHGLMINCILPSLSCFCSNLGSEKSIFFPSCHDMIVFQKDVRSKFLLINKSFLKSFSSVDLHYTACQTNMEHKAEIWAVNEIWALRLRLSFKARNLVKWTYAIDGLTKRYNMI